MPINLPLPFLFDLIDRIGEAQPKYFSKIDMNNAFFQIPLDPEIAHKTSFVTQEGEFSFSRRPIGLANGPLCFQATMAEIFRSLKLEKIANFH